MSLNKGGALKWGNIDLREEPIHEYALYHCSVITNPNL